MSQTPQTPVAEPDNLSLARNAKIGMFHVGSSMADILASGVWNRVAIAELGFQATPVALLLGLRYFMAPLAIWVGQRSDVRPWHGYHRLPYIWPGRILMMISFVILGFGTVWVSETGAPLGWIALVASVLLFSVGSAFSGTTYLALIHDVAPPSQRTRAVSMVWSFLILGFAISGIVFGKLLPTYTREGFLALFIISPLIMGALWFLSLLGEEKRVPVDETVIAKTVEMRPFWKDLRAAWANQQTRVFLIFLSLTAGLFYMQDSILEPFAAQVFTMPTATTSRFSAYWGTMALIGIVGSLLVARRYPTRVTNVTLSRWGVYILILSFVMLTVCAFGQVRPLVTIGLIVLGLGLGIWTVGTLGLMMNMTAIAGAGLYLSIWTVAETLSRGAGTVVGGILRDIAYAFSHQFTTAYGTVFFVQTVGFMAAILVLSRVNVRKFEEQVPATQMILEGAMN